MCQFMLDKQTDLYMSIWYALSDYTYSYLHIIVYTHINILHMHTYVHNRYSTPTCMYKHI